MKELATACASRVHKSKHLARELATLLAAVPYAEITGLLSITTALVDMARSAVQKSITAEESIRDGMAIALGRRAGPRL